MYAIKEMREIWFNSAKNPVVLENISSFSTREGNIVIYKR